MASKINILNSDFASIDGAGSLNLRRSRSLVPRLLVFFALSCFGQVLFATQDVLKVMYDELQRSFTGLQDHPEPPYFLSYEITEDVAVTVIGSSGVINEKSRVLSRYLDVDLRVGAFSLDNTHPLRSSQGAPIQETLAIPQSIAVDSADALRESLWYHTDNAYRNALTRYTRVKSAVQRAVNRGYFPGDFSRAPVARYEEETILLDANLEEWASKIREYTKPFAESEIIETNAAIVTGDIETRWLVNSEGTRVKVSNPYYILWIEATTKADDGMVLSRGRTFAAKTPEGIFDDEKVLNAVSSMVDDLTNLRSAPLVDPFEGPALLSARAAGVFFHEVLGHRVEGHRQRTVDDNLSLRDFLGKTILPNTFTVYFDPSIQMFDGKELFGSYKYDNQGVKGRRVNVVRNGVLRGFLMSRTPIDGFHQSNGHGRKNFAHPALSRQSNLFVQVSNGISKEELENLLIKRINEQGKPFGLYFEDVESGFNLTASGMPSAFNIKPVMVYKMYPDATRELVRGVDLIGTPLTTFSRIEAGASDYEVWSELCDAESGQVPVSSIAPSILISQVEVQKAESERSIPRILPPPASLENNPTDTTPAMAR
ncbi:MAG: metallopeptidase TldD-related protein [Gammaproteobacteria bacterium]|nr:metallopeptidase TldD-related protein [Gammaproteobacteria bacterium]